MSQIKKIKKTKRKETERCLKLQSSLVKHTEPWP